MPTNSAPVVQAVIYARCSTDESRQDVENQLKELRRYCDAYGWNYTEVAEYCSGFKEPQPKLQVVLDQVRRKQYQAFLVFSLDRFSRQHPSKVNALLDQVVYQYGCRFITLQEGLDSQNEMVWHVVRPLFAYFANIFSRNLSEKIRFGIKTKKAKGQYQGGRPRKSVLIDRLKQIRLAHPGYGWVRLAHAYNEGLESRQQISVSLLRKVYKTVSFETVSSDDWPTNGMHKAGARNPA